MMNKHLRSLSKTQRPASAAIIYDPGPPPWVILLTSWFYRLHEAFSKGDDA